jgi:hypothetical protein
MIVNTVEICEGTHGKYYRLNGINYDIRFPLCWATEHIDSESGPINCSNCFDFGHENGVFVAYCANCTYFIHNEERGQYHEDAPTKIKLENFDYMKGVSWDQIGDSLLKREHEVPVQKYDEEEEEEDYEEDYSIFDYLGAYKSNLVYDYALCVSPSSTVSSEENDEEKEVNENREFKELEKAIQLGHITFKEKMYNTINMCGNN